MPMHGIFGQVRARRCFHDSIANVLLIGSAVVALNHSHHQQQHHNQTFRLSSEKGANISIPRHESGIRKSVFKDVGEGGAEQKW